MKAPLLLIFLLLPTIIHAQFGPQIADGFHPDNAIRGDRHAPQKRERPARPDKELVRGIGFLPGHMHRVEGLTISAHTERKNGKPLEIRGVNMDFQPLGVFVVPYVVLFQPFSVAGASRHDTIGTRGAAFAPEDTLVQIKGLDLRLMGSFPAASLNGLGMTAGVSTYPVQRGAAISVFGNLSEELHGLQLALWANNASSGRGVQIGLFNKSEQCDCLQFGLLNRNAKRLMPFVNW